MIVLSALDASRPWRMPGGPLAGIGPRTHGLAFVLAVAVSACAGRGDAPRPVESVDGRSSADTTKAEEGPEDGAWDAARDAVDGAPADLDGGRDAPDTASDDSRDSRPADAGPSPCNQPGDAGDGGRPYFDLIVGGRWNVPDGRRMFVLTREYSSMIPRGHGSAVIKDGSFLIRLPRAYLNFSYQPIFYFLDVDDDGRCDEAIDRTGSELTNACQMQDCEGVLHEGPDRPVDGRGNHVCSLMNACR